MGIPMIPRRPFRVRNLGGLFPHLGVGVWRYSGVRPEHRSYRAFRKRRVSLDMSEELQNQLRTLLAQIEEERPRIIHKYQLAEELGRSEEVEQHHAVLLSLGSLEEAAAATLRAAQ